MKFAFKFSMPKWERPKVEAPYIPNPIINELEKVDFASLTAERRRDILHRLKLACADIAEDRRHQPAILSDRIRLQQMWQDYFRIAQTTPAGDNQGENLSISRYSEQEEEEKPRALGAVMTMQEELVAAANFKIDMGGMDINDLDDYDDFSASSIPRAAPPPAPPSAPPAHSHAAHPSRPAAQASEAKAATETTTAEQELAEQMAKIKAVAPMALPVMEFPTEDPVTLVEATPVPDHGLEVPGTETSAFSIDMAGLQDQDEAPPASDAGAALSPEQELAEQMAKIKAVDPIALPVMEFPTEQAAPAAVAEEAGEQSPFSIEIGEADVHPAADHRLADLEAEAAPEPAPLSPKDELAEQMAKIKAVTPMALPPLPHHADESGAHHDQSVTTLDVETHAHTDHPDVLELVEDSTLEIHDGHFDEGGQTLAQEPPLVIDVQEAESLTITPVKASDTADASGFKPLTVPALAEEAAPVQVAQTEVQTREAPAAEAPVPEVPPAPEAITPAIAVVAAPEPEPKPKKSKKAGALASLRSMLSSKQTDEPADQETASPVADPQREAESPPQEPVAEAVPEPVAEAVLAPKEREVSATPSTKEWVNIKLLRPSVIRGLPLPDQVITIVPYSEAKRLEENGSAIILTKPRTPRNPSS